MIKVNYKNKTEILKLNDKVYVLEAIANLDEAIDELCNAMNETEKSDPFAEDLCPYFGVFWPAAHALGIYLSENNKILKNKSVLELGCGLGFPSLVASFYGADVLATDFHPDVEEYFLRNCKHSSVNANYMRLNWRDENQTIGQFDFVIGSDILYESKHSSEVARGLIRFLKPNGVIILADPGRSYLQKFIHAMNEENFKEEFVPISVGDTDIFVFKFQKS